MKTVDSTLIRNILKDTEFENLIEKFESAGDTNLRNFTIKSNQGVLLSYLKNFEDDELKVLRLQKLLREEMVSSSKPVLNTILFVVCGIFIAIFIYLLSFIGF